MGTNLFCTFFGHKFGEWEYVADVSCEQIRVCKRDRFKEKRHGSHQFSEWKYTTDDSCEQIRVCKRDGYEERGRVSHQFGEWEYVADNFCEQVRICKRCGEHQFREKIHIWGDWNESPDTRTKVRICKRCGEKSEITYGICPSCGSPLKEESVGYDSHTVTEMLICTNPSCYYTTSP